MDSKLEDKKRLNEKGKLVAAFCSNKQAIWEAILKYSVGMAIGFGLMVYGILKEVEFNVTMIWFSLGMCFVLLAWSMATRHKKPRIIVYENGLWFKPKLGRAAKGFYKWNEVAKAEQQRYEENTSPTYRFLPGYCVCLNDGKQWWAKQTLANYTGLYQLLYQYGVKNAQKPLYLFDVDIEGFQMKNEAWYNAVFYPDKDKLVKERGQPIVY